MQAELSSFFVDDVPGTIMFVLSPLGALYMLFHFEIWIGLIALTYFACMLIFNRYIYPRSKRLHQVLNNRSENSIAMMDAREFSELQDHYVNLAEDNIRISDLDAKTWSVVESATMILFMLILLRLGIISRLSVGSAYAVVSYGGRFTDGVTHLPYIMQRIARLADIRKRIESEEAVL